MNKVFYGLGLTVVLNLDGPSAGQPNSPLGGIKEFKPVGSSSVTGTIDGYSADIFEKSVNFRGKVTNQE